MREHAVIFLTNSSFFASYSAFSALEVFCASQFNKMFASFSSVPFFSLSSLFLSFRAEALSVLQGPADIHTDANDTTGFEAVRSALSPLASLSLSVSSFLILATFTLVLPSWAIRQSEKSQLAHGGNQTSFSCPFNTGINFLQG